MNNNTINYYNNNAEEYFATSKDVDLDKLRKRFLSYLPAGARIIDVGCGSGRDVRAFLDMGFDAVGLDASSELAKLASEQLGIKITVGDMSSWVADEPYDGIWSCASLLHLSNEELESFFSNLSHNLKEDGIVMISVKSGIKTGYDENTRYMRNFNLQEIERMLDAADCQIIESGSSKDSMQRTDFKWLNVIARKE